MDIFCIILEILFILQFYSINLTLELIFFFNINQIFPLEILCQISWISKFITMLFK
jgi:hypothetical protein